MGVDDFLKVDVSPCHDSLDDCVSIFLSQFTSPESFQQFCKLWIALELMFIVKNDDSDQDILKKLV